MVEDQRYLIYTDVGEGEWGAHDLIMERQQIAPRELLGQGFSRALVCLSVCLSVSLLSLLVLSSLACRGDGSTTDISEASPIGKRVVMIRRRSNMYRANLYFRNYTKTRRRRGWSGGARDPASDVQRVWSSSQAQRLAQPGRSRSATLEEKFSLIRAPPYSFRFFLARGRDAGADLVIEATKD